MRSNAKMCEALGLEKHEYYAYHKNHIDKVMVVCFTAFAFKGSIINGGDAMKLGMFRCQSARIAKRQVGEARFLEDGSRKYDGKILREKGDVYLIDCNVTGSTEGSSDEPKFSLMHLFHSIIFPRIHDLVKPGGQYEGYKVVIQGDRAGLHTDKEFTDYTTSYCATNGYLWEPQAPQMPHMNNLDLAVFPCMSKRHTTNLRQRAIGKAVNRDEIWSACESVWRELPSSTIARGFVLAHHVAKQVIKYKGSNKFLHNDDFHAGVRAQYYNTEKGVKPKVYVVDK